MVYKNGENFKKFCEEQPNSARSPKASSTDGKCNRPLLSSKDPHFQNEAKCTTFLVKMSFIHMRLVTAKENEFYLHENKKSFPHQRRST